MYNKHDEKLFVEIAASEHIAISEVRRAVNSFFGSLVREARRLPFSDPTRIYSKDKFEEFASVTNIPYMGRIGPVYSRYLKWRGNESKNIVQKRRSDYCGGVSRDDIEHIAEEILAGRTPPVLVKKRGNEMYNRVWLVGKDGKKLARQVMPKNEE